jgi:ABC-type uncharacterized transport system substrate-binding protein
MKRRAFIALLGGAAAMPSFLWPLAARAQQKPPTIGFLGPASASAMSAWTAAFVQRLRELGWIEGRTIAIEYRWGDGRADRLPEIAAEFVRLKVDVIVTTGTPVPLLKEATSTIPIVFTIANDPIGGGLVRSLSRPGGNVTGLSQLAADLGGKRLELLRDVVPGLRRLATLSNVGNAVTASEMTQVSEAARTLGLEVVNSEIRRAEDLTPAIEALKGRADAIYVQTDPLTLTAKRGGRTPHPGEHREQRNARLGDQTSLAGIDIHSARASARSVDVVQFGFSRAGSPECGLCRQDPQGRQAGRSAGRLSHQVLVDHQSPDRQGARPYRAADPARPRRRGDRMKVICHARA